MGPKTLPTIWYTYMKLVTRFLPSIVAEKKTTKYILGRMEGRTEVKQYTPPPPLVERGYNNYPKVSFDI
jgi:hypothetical protein